MLKHQKVIGCNVQTRIMRQITPFTIGKLSETAIFSHKSKTIEFNQIDIFSFKLIDTRKRQIENFPTATYKYFT